MARAPVALRFRRCDAASGPLVDSAVRDGRTGPARVARPPTPLVVARGLFLARPLNLAGQGCVAGNPAVGDAFIQLAFGMPMHAIRQLAIENRTTLTAGFKEKARVGMGLLSSSQQDSTGGLREALLTNAEASK